MNQIKIQVENLTEVLTLYDRIKVYRSNTGEDGTFAEISDSSSRPVLNNQDNLYIYTDNSGTGSHFYKASYFNTSNSTESSLSGTIAAVSITQLVENMQVVITLAKTIKNTSGVSLAEDFEFYFTTTYTPMYSSITRIRLDIGKFIQGIPEDTINLAIFEASREAEYLTFVKDASQHSDLFKHARRQWSTCKAEQILLANAYAGAGGLLKSKRLADFAVEYDKSVISDLDKRLLNCMARWEAELNSGGKAIQTPSMVVKGELDPDRPAIGRSWDDPGGMPIGNGKVRYEGTRRWLKTYVPRPKWSSED